MAINGAARPPAAASASVRDKEAAGIGKEPDVLCQMPGAKQLARPPEGRSNDLSEVDERELRGQAKSASSRSGKAGSVMLCRSQKRKNITNHFRCSNGKRANHLQAKGNEATNSLQQEKLLRSKLKGKRQRQSPQS